MKDTLFRDGHPIETEVHEHLVKEIQEEIDWSIMCDMLKQCGWTIVRRSPWFNNGDAERVKLWLNTRCTHNVKSRGHTWAFESAEEALMFRLTWP